MNLSFFKYIIVFAVSMTLGFFLYDFFDEKPSDIEFMSEGFLLQQYRKGDINNLL